MNEIVHNLKIMFVDDEQTLMEDLKEFFQDYRIDFFSDPQKALSELDYNYFDIIIADYKMPKVTGLDLLLSAREKNAYGYGVLFTAYADKYLLEKVINEGLVNHYIEKPVSLFELKKFLDKIISERSNNKEQEKYLKLLDIENQELKHRLFEQNPKIIGLDRGLKKIFEDVLKISKLTVNVLITGETGTGKEVVARLIHFSGKRKEKPFIKINCSAIPQNLLESELFGFEKGAFTGAVNSKPGKIELAHQGTLFLDEIGEMDINIQAKLLNVIQEKKLSRLGSIKTIGVDFQLICATNRNLEKAVKKGDFRQDLYYRINNYPLHLLPLRERKEDIEDLAVFNVNKFCGEINRPPKIISDDALKVVLKYDWPGNVRELENAIMRAIIVSGSNTALTGSDFKFLNLSGTESDENELIDRLTELVISKKIDMESLKESLIKTILKKFDGKILDAVKATGIAKHHFYKYR
ncbi:sigma-54-dependent Fis family transcriptional regulator [candidate division WOR-3 bacterium]|nr:sigma-54-dependent Fis family transcriptional regulator [candidate division WOR-3 bacterium]